MAASNIAPLVQRGARIETKKDVLASIKRSKAENAAIAAPRPGATVPTILKPAPPPRTMSTAETQATAQPPIQPLAPPAAADQQPPGEGNVLEVLFARALRNRSDTKPADDPGMAMLQALTHQVQTGQPLKEIENVVVPHLGEMSSKIHLFLNAMAYHNMFERGSMLALARWTLEKSLWEDLIQQKLSPVEKLALLNLAVKEMDKVTTNLGNFQSNLETGGKGTTADIESATEKADRTIEKAEDPTMKDLVGTSAVGRELARRIVSGATKVAEQHVQEAIKQTPA